VNEVKHKLVVVWDIFMEDYRNVSMENCYLLRKTPADDRFWKYWDEALSFLQVQDRFDFMDHGGM
jgi:hypothetical protein